MTQDPSKEQKLGSILARRPTQTLENGARCFLPGDRSPRRTAGHGLQGWLQDRLKRTGLFYKILVWAFSPVMRTPYVIRRIRSLLQHYTEAHTILTLGSGPHTIGGRRDIINLDLFAFDGVDLVADTRDVPLRSGQVDCIFSIGMLEHVEHPERAIAEIHRLLRPGGQSLCIAPLLQPLHAAPHDFQRWSPSGLRTLFEDFEDVEVGIAFGPTSGALWTLIEWLALFLSFGSRTLRDAIFLVLTVVTSPIKLLDLYLVHLPGAERIASAFVVIARKGPDSETA